MKHLNQQPVFISERAGKCYEKMGRCLQVHIQIKEPFFVLYATNQVQSRFHCHHPPDNLPQLYVFQLK